MPAFISQTRGNPHVSSTGRADKAVRKPALLSAAGQNVNRCKPLGRQRGALCLQICRRLGAVLPLVSGAAGGVGTQLCCSVFAVK